MKTSDIQHIERHMNKRVDAVNERLRGLIGKAVHIKSGELTGRFARVREAFYDSTARRVLFSLDVPKILHRVQGNNLNTLAARTCYSADQLRFDDPGAIP